VHSEVELANPVLADIRVQAGSIVVAAGLMRAGKAVLIPAKAGTAEQEAFFLGEIAKGREVESVVVIDRPSYFARVERGLYLASTGVRKVWVR